MMNKKIFSIFCLGVMGILPCVAQQALWGGSDIVSPELQEDGRVTFRINAPEARTVEVQGDFLATQLYETPFGKTAGPGRAALHKDENGLWTYTTDSLASELYCYTFRVDGLQVADPNNVFQLRDVATISNYFIIGNGCGDIYKVQNVPHGTLIKEWYDSPTLGGEQRRMTIYLPAGYNKNQDTYPVLYLLHGSGGDENAWSELGRLTQILDNLIAQGKARPMLVVMPNGNVSQSAAPGEASGPMVKPSLTESRRKNGEFERSFPDIVNYVEQHYRVIKEKHGRALAGLSMGGFHTLYISANYPDMFDYIGLFSAANTVEKKSEMYQDLEGKLQTLFAGHPKLYWIGIGKEDFLYEKNKALRAMLDANQYPYTYYESEGGHIWKNWRIYLSRFLTELFIK